MMPGSAAMLSMSHRALLLRLLNSNANMVQASHAFPPYPLLTAATCAHRLKMAQARYVRHRAPCGVEHPHRRAARSGTHA